MTPCVVERKPFPNQIRRESTAYPINSVEYALHIKVGDPKWANYGIIRLIIGKDRKTGRPNAYMKNIFKPNWPAHHENHPFNKPVGLYVQLLKAFSKPEHNILEAFAGTCTSVEACLELGRNLVLVEKDPQQKKLFQERIALTQVKLAQMGGEDEPQAQPLASMVEGSSTGTARNPKRRLTSPTPNPPKKTRTEVAREEEEEEEEQEDEEGEEEEEEQEQEEDDEEGEEERDSDKDSYASNPKSDDSSDHDFIPKSPSYPADTQESSSREPALESTSLESVVQPSGKKTKPRSKEPASTQSKKGFVSLSALVKKKSKQQNE